MKYVLGLGTNLGNRLENIEKCIECINLTPNTKVIERSGIYETEPWGYEKQDNFYNCVILAQSLLNSHEMLGLCLGIESGFGRKRKILYGPRILDIDLLFAENAEIKTENLTVPHPHIRERRFVLEPLADIFPGGECYGYEFKSSLKSTENQYVKKIKEKINY
ncbi:MAG: 2-amino-4-hydroxy-6-hydroxymethyldihydropteridine diphosphokinase [Clostridiales bacterium]|nr:2-amino-4-hydroxy-6-hydroxymethyldihydropteridine diphosphokinase [Clostridiales bacterium]